MADLQPGDIAPDFSGSTQTGEIALKNLRGKTVILFFYPKDNTPGCTTESNDFKADYQKFRRRGATVLGISRDSVASHEKFKSKFDFPFDLLSDADEKVCQLFDVIKEKNMYGRKVLGIVRSTFLIDETGKLRQEWRKVKVAGHVDQVLAAVKAL